MSNSGLEASSDPGRRAKDIDQQRVGQPLMVVEQLDVKDIVRVLAILRRVVPPFSAKAVSGAIKGQAAPTARRGRHITGHRQRLLRFRRTPGEP